MPNNLLRKKAQIQNMESIAVIIIIGIMIVLGIVFAFTYKKDQITRDISEQASVEALTIALRAESLDELRCSTFTSSGTLCFDYYKLTSMETFLQDSNQLEAHQYYYDQFKETEITINLIYPAVPTGMKAKITPFNFSKENPKSVNTLFFPVLVYDPVTRIDYFSIIQVKVTK